jgi:hypothetical protein
LDLVPRPVGLLVRLSTILDDMTATTAEEVGALKANRASLEAAMIVGKAKVHTRHVGGRRLV